MGCATGEADWRAWNDPQEHHKQLQLYIVHPVTLEENLALEDLQPGSVVLMHVYLKMHIHRIWRCNLPKIIPLGI